MSKLTLEEVKQALWDEKFRALFPNMQKEINAFLKDPGCSCNNKLYRQILSQRDKLNKFFPGREIELHETKQLEQDISAKLRQNQWTVINCHIDKLEERLKKLPHGKKMVSLSRYQDQITVVIDEMMAF
jgi:hypothetical protein